MTDDLTPMTVVEWCLIRWRNAMARTELEPEEAKRVRLALEERERYREALTEISAGGNSDDAWWADMAARALGEVHNE